jgi:DNA-directed RNA polymerase specialized sigma24 family protein
LPSRGQRPGPTRSSLLSIASGLTASKRALMALTRFQRQCLHLRVEGLRYREIAELFGVSVATVAEAVRRGLVNLAAQINPEEKP